MKLVSEALERRRLRAPAEDGGKLIEPPLESVGELIEQNVAEASAYDYDLQGISLRDLACQGRRELVEAAWNYSRTYRDVPRPAAGKCHRVLLAGHQPQLFHPGVWFKNFVLADIARNEGGVAINLTIDSDTIKTASVRVPTGTVDEPRVESVPLDRHTAEIPYEERRIVDRACLDSFGDRARETIRSLVSDPLVREFWPLVSARARACDNLGQCIAEARHQQEGLWGISTLELPQGHVCDLPSFHRFACHLLAQMPRLWEQYNQAVADYRKANRVRSAAHPVPDLAIEDGWLEAPFWIWDRENPRRRPLFVRQRGDEIVLSDRGKLEYALSLSPEGEGGRAAEQLAEFAAGGMRLRTRALITTLFARLLLGDLFLHGIGGAKYDQVTEALIERFFGLRPPGSMTLTATLRLPVARVAVTLDDARAIEGGLRDLVFHPERSIDANAAAAGLAATKRRWIETTPTRANAKERCHAIRGVNDALQPYVAGERDKLLARRDRVAAALRNKNMLASREYAFCLYPAESLRQLMGIS